MLAMSLPPFLAWAASLNWKASAMISQRVVDRRSVNSSASLLPWESKISCLLFQWCNGVPVSVASLYMGWGTSASVQAWIQFGPLNHRSARRTLRVRMSIELHVNGVS